MTRPRPDVPAALRTAAELREGTVPRPRTSPAGPPAPAPDEPAVAVPPAGVQPTRVEPTDVEPTDVEPTDVWELVRRTQDGDPEAFGELYDRYADVVFRYLHHRLGDRTTAEDLTSETFVRALRRIDSLSFRGRDVGAWLITIARNLALDHVKSSRHRLEVPTADMRDADRATPGPEEAVLAQLTNADLLAGVQQLSPDQRECLELRFLQDLTVAETAAAMGRKDGAVKALQHRAVRRLAALLPAGLW